MQQTGRHVFRPPPRGSTAEQGAHHQAKVGSAHVQQVMKHLVIDRRYYL